MRIHASKEIAGWIEIAHGSLGAALKNSIVWDFWKSPNVPGIAQQLIAQECDLGVHHH